MGYVSGASPRRLRVYHGLYHFDFFFFIKIFLVEKGCKVRLQNQRVLMENATRLLIKHNTIFVAVKEL